MGDHVMLKCRVIAGYPMPTLKWTRSDPNLKSDRIEEKPDGSIWISNITAAEAGEYVCHASSITQEISKSATITIQQPSFTVTVYPDASEISLVEGDKLNLYCNSELSTNVMWYKRDTADRVENIDKKLFSIPYSATYKKHNISGSDSGTYVCRVTNKYGKIEKQIKVSVQPKENAGEFLFEKQF